MMERGKLKIFFGYSAGVGKTYAMLKAAQEAKQEGLDVVIGYLEPHDRPETLQMAEGLERLPLRTFHYKGIQLQEFDVDAALARRPRILLVDELAHTNAAGSKNAKRYIDVEELVGSGIEVWTTVNVQHIEGLHDLIDAATSVDVSERIPDEIFDYADEVVLVDIEPAALIERMREGKIYGKTRAATALENFFRTEHLSALRELYMRRNADRIEKQNHNGQRKTQILVLISPSPSAEKNIHIAARMAEAYHCRFSALYVERNGDLSDQSAANLKRHMRLVKDLGGEMVVKYGEDVVETVADYARIAGITDLVIGKTWQSVGKKMGFEDKFIARMPQVQILIVPDSTHIDCRKSAIRELFERLFLPRRLLQKYRTANRTLDIHNVIEREIQNSNLPEQTIADVLCRAFMRSTTVFGAKDTFSSWREEDLSFWTAPNEKAVAEWVKKNSRPAGRGSETLREAKALYLPVMTKHGTVVVAFSCRDSKLTVTDRLIFSQIVPLLSLIL